MNGPPNISSVSNVACWYVVHTHASQERRAEKNLNMWGIETFHPQMKKVQSNSGLRKPGVVIKSVFPCYLFARFNPDFICIRLALHEECVRSYVLTETLFLSGKKSSL